MLNGGSMYVVKDFFFICSQRTESDVDETGQGGSRGNKATGVDTAQCNECNGCRF